MSLLRTAVAKKLKKYAQEDADIDLPDLDIIDDGPPKAGPDEDLEMEVEEEVEVTEKEEEPKEDSDTESLEETVEVLVDAVSEMKEVLEEGLGLREPDQDLKDYKEEESEEALDEMTVTEFGIDTDDLIMSNKEVDSMSIKSLRTSRKRRLATMNRRAAYGDGGSKSWAEEMNLEKDKKERFGPKSDVPKITKMKKSEVPENLKLASLALELSDSKDVWSVTDKTGKVLYRIHASNLELPATVFSHRKFAEKVIKDMQRMGIEQALLGKRYKAEKCIDEKKVPGKKGPGKKAPGKAINKEKLEAYRKSKERNAATAGSDHKRRWARAARLAMTALNKNLVNGGSNPLKASFYNILTAAIRLDASTAEAVIEEAFAEGGKQYMDALMAQADSYMEMEDRAFAETEAVVGEMTAKRVEIQNDADDDPLLSQHANKLRARASKSSIPVQSYKMEDDAMESDATDQLTNAFLSVGVKPKLAGVSKYAGMLNKQTMFRQ